MGLLLMRAAAGGGGGASLWNARCSTSCSLPQWRRLIKSSAMFSANTGTGLSSFLSPSRQQKQQSNRLQQQYGSIATAASSCCLPTTTKTTTEETTTTTPAAEEKTAAAIHVPDQSINPKLLLQAFAELELKPIQEMVGGVRVRQHVNPLKASLMAPLAPVNWETVFANCTLPLMVDIGCGSGRFLLVLAKRSSGTQNYLGLDVRERLIDRAKLWAEELDLSSNMHFVTCNATVALNSLLATYPGPLAFVSILCPDPHFKRRHQKRKVVQKRLVDVIIDRLTPGGGVFLQSDVKDVASDMRAQFDEHLGSSLQVSGATGDGSDDGLVKWDPEGWVEQNPLGVPSEREAQVLANGGRIYRVVYRKI